MTTLAKLSGKSDLAGTIVRHLDQTKHCYAIYPRASGADRRIVNPPVTRRLSSVITITGTGDHLRLDQPIIITGMRSCGICCAPTSSPAGRRKRR